MKNPFNSPKKLPTGFLVAIFSMTFGTGYLMMAFAYDYKSEKRLRDDQMIWGVSMNDEREEISKDLKRYHRLWHENGSEIKRKTREDLKAFRKANNV